MDLLDVLQKQLCRRTEQIARLSGIDCSGFRMEMAQSKGSNIGPSTPCRFGAQPRAGFPNPLEQRLSLEFRHRPSRPGSRP